MSKKSHPYQGLVDKFHHREIKEYQPDVIFEEYQDFTLRITDGVVCVQSKIRFREISETENSQKQIIREQPFDMVKSDPSLDAIKCFHSGGGCVVDTPVFEWCKPELEEDENIPILEIEDDRRNYGFDKFISEFFGGNLSLVTDPARFVGRGF